jgi:IS5 family transposase
VNEVHAPDVARTRLMGLAKNLTLFGLAAIAHNIQKGAKFLRLYGMPEPACAK